MSREIYIGAKAIDIPTEAVTSVGDIDISGNDLFEEAVIPDYSVGVVGSRRFKKTLGAVSLTRPTKYHGRSFDVHYEGIEPFVWEDEYGIRYSVYTIKGNNFTDIGIMETLTSPSGYALKGLQDSDCLARIVRASEELRRIGIPTENIVRVLVPEQIPFEGRMMTQEELKAAIIEKELVGDKPVQTPSSGSAILDSLNDFMGDASREKKLAFLRDTRFVVTVRAMQVSERITDLTYVKTRAQATELITNAFRFLNLDEAITAKREGRPADFLDPTEGGDVWTWFSLLLPQKLGSDFAKMHNAGLVHKFPHPGNVSLVGSIYDLDSVEGAPLGLGDEEINPTKTAEDLYYLLSELPQDLAEFFDKGFYKRDLKRPFKDLGIGEDYDFSADFVLNFLLTYLSEYEGELDIFSLGEILYPAVALGLSRGADLANKLLEKSNLDYWLEATDEEIIAGFYKFLPFPVSYLIGDIIMDPEAGNPTEGSDSGSVRTLSKTEIVDMVTDTIINNGEYGLRAHILTTIRADLIRLARKSGIERKRDGIAGLTKIIYLRDWPLRTAEISKKYEAEIIMNVEKTARAELKKFLKRVRVEVPVIVDN